MERKNSSTKNPKSTEDEDIFSYSMNTNIPYKNLRESLVKTKRWMEYADMARMKNTIFKELKNSTKFSIKEVNQRGIITNENNNEKIVYLDPRLYDTTDRDANAEKMERIEAINNLLDDDGIKGEITFTQPISTNQKHWTLVCFKVNLDETKRIRQNKGKNLTVDDLDNLIQGNQYEVNSLKDGRQQDGYSCGVHTMDAFVELCDYGFDEYKKIYGERCKKYNKNNTKRHNKNRKSTKKSNHIKGENTTQKTQTTNNSKQFTEYDIKSNNQMHELIKKKGTLAKTLGLDNITKKFFIDYEFFDEDTIESIKGVLKETKNPDEKKELIRDIKGNIAIAMKEANKQFAKGTGKRGRSSPNLGK